MKNQKTIFLILISAVLLIPIVVSAVWWNPFTWFKKKVVEPVQTYQAPNVTLIVTPTPEVNPTGGIPEEVIKTNNSSSTKVPTPISVVPVVSTPVPQPAVNLSTTDVISVYDIFVVPSNTSAKVSWKTNIATESKVLLEGGSYFSERGVGTMHTVTINGLESDLLYGGTVTAIANNSWKSQNFTFTTEKTSLKITLVSKNCPTDRCTVSWKTNYSTSSRIKVIKESSGETVKSVNLTSTGKEHLIELNLEPNTKYTYEIYATSETQSAELMGELETLVAPIQNSSGGCGGWFCGHTPSA